MRRAAASLAVVMTFVLTDRLAEPGAASQQKPPSVSAAWIKLPPAGASSTEAYATVENPTMYDFYVQKASSDMAGSVELRESGKAAALEFVTVPAYGTLEMAPDGIHLVLRDLKKPLAEGETVNLTIVTDQGLKLEVEATVRSR
jgi:copper(I)-binding protein